MLLSVLQCTGQSPYNKGLSKALLREPGKWKSHHQASFPQTGRGEGSGQPAAGLDGDTDPQGPGQLRALLLVLGDPGNTWFLPPEERKRGRVRV